VWPGPVAAWVTAGLMLNSDAGPLFVVPGATLLTAALAMGLWETHMGPLRAVAAGLAGSWAALIVVAIGLGLLHERVTGSVRPPGWRLGA
jgi:hypothetical protein